MKPLLIGECNPYGPDPEFALYPRPRGCAGWRLCTMVMGMAESEYLRAFDRVNLCPVNWSNPVAVKRAAELTLTREMPAPFVLCGVRVARAFGLPSDPFKLYLRGGRHVVVLPHPSGRCRAWNEPGAIERARFALLGAGITNVRTASAR